MYFLAIILAYVLCFGLTSVLIAPLQSIFLPELTVFASLIYLPHGVRVLATWAYGWRAIPALFLAGGVSTWLFRGEQDIEILSPMLVESLLVGACCAFLAFEVARFFGFRAYLGQERRLHWKDMLALGLLSSLFNSIGQIIVFYGLVGVESAISVAAIYAVGDLLGLVVCMFALMLVFRWLR